MTPGASDRDPDNTGQKSDSHAGPSKTTLATSAIEEAKTTPAAPAAKKPGQTHQLIEKRADTLNRQVPKGTGTPAAAPLHPSVNPNSRQKITKEKILGMTKPEIKAVAHDRGYKLGADAGRKVLAARFLEAQEKDTSLIVLK